MMKNDICILLPYFGKFNNYFTLWLLSCKYNSQIDWYIFTDDCTKYSYPTNVKVIYCNFSDIQHAAYKLWGKDISLDKPYNLCKFKVAYHIIFQDIIEKYKYWGFCDCDLIFGNIYSAILPAIVQKYDKISWRGHFTLFKNTLDNKDTFLQVIPNVHTFKDCISKARKKYYNLFDEVGINFIFDSCGKKVYKDLLIADLKVKSYNFVCKHFSQAEEFKNKHQIFEWNNGHLYRCYLFNGNLFKEEFAYVHFLRREMKNHIRNINTFHYLIIPPNKFIDYQDITPEKILLWTKKKFYWNYFTKRASPLYIYHLILSRLNGENKKIPDIYPFIIK